MIGWWRTSNSDQKHLLEIWRLDNKIYVTNLDDKTKDLCKNDMFNHEIMSLYCKLYGGYIIVVSCTNTSCLSDLEITNEYYINSRLYRNEYDIDMKKFYATCQKCKQKYEFNRNASQPYLVLSKVIDYNQKTNNKNRLKMD